MNAIQVIFSLAHIRSGLSIGMETNFPLTSIGMDNNSPRHQFGETRRSFISSLYYQPSSVACQRSTWFDEVTGHVSRRPHISEECEMDQLAYYCESIRFAIKVDDDTSVIER